MNSCFYDFELYKVDAYSESIFTTFSEEDLKL